MGQTTGISWTDHTFNPHIGCAKVHAGCAHCYAERDFDTRRGVAQWGQHGTRIVTSEANWKQPLKWNRDAEAAGERRRVFCASLADVFESWDGPILRHGSVLAKPYLERENQMSNWIETSDDDLKTDPQGWRPATLQDVRDELFRLIDSTRCLDWLLLTKRPENVLRMWPGALPRENVWLGTSVSDQETADRMIPSLLMCRDLSPVLFLSAEPLLGALTFRWAKWQPFADQAGGLTDELDGLRRLDWVIAGGESGPQFRQMMTEDVRRLRDQCVAANVPFFFKQWGGVNPKTLGKEIDGREWCEFPTVGGSV